MAFMPMPPHPMTGDVVARLTRRTDELKPVATP